VTQKEHSFDTRRVLWDKSETKQKELPSLTQAFHQRTRRRQPRSGFWIQFRS